MSNDEDTDSEFERTADIGRMIGVLAEAELVVAAVDEIQPEHQARLDQVIANVLKEIEREGG